MLVLQMSIKSYQFILYFGNTLCIYMDFLLSFFAGLQSDSLCWTT